MWPSEMPACQIVEGGIIVDAKTVAFAAQELMHKVNDQLVEENARLRAHCDRVNAENRDLHELLRRERETVACLTPRP